jgi:excisionase family DNA binding protein
MPEENVLHSLLTIKEVAAYLRIPVATAYYLAQRGQIPAIQIGGRWRIKKSALDRDVLREGKSGQRTVLVVEDDPALQALFKVFLKKSGFGRVVVGTASEAIASLGKQKFDLMFLDLVLPDAGGDFVYENAMRIDPDLIVVVITGHPNSEALVRILRMSPVIVVKKPFAIDALQRLTSILGHKEVELDQAGATMHGA